MCSDRAPPTLTNINADLIALHVLPLMLTCEVDCVEGPHIWETTRTAHTQPARSASRGVFQLNDNVCSYS